mmetsp:Transcript_27408/g.82259  ORF Transcript_27408/g.82259 Transcript_27408/m.82259 type:complete len:231 (+) Transcript_27408:400-1092(+)
MDRRARVQHAGAVDLGRSRRHRVPEPGLARVVRGKYGVTRQDPGPAASASGAPGQEELVHDAGAPRRGRGARAHQRVRRRGVPFVSVDLRGGVQFVSAHQPRRGGLGRLRPSSSRRGPSDSGGTGPRDHDADQLRALRRPRGAGGERLRPHGAALCFPSDVLPPAGRRARRLRGRRERAGARAHEPRAALVRDGRRRVSLRLSGCARRHRGRDYGARTSGAGRRIIEREL